MSMIDRAKTFALTRPGTAGLVLVAAFAALTLGGAWALQLIWNYYPCPLCLQQREPWYVAGAMALVLLAAPYVSRTWGPRIQVWALPVLALIIGYGAQRAAFHVGVEQGWWTYVCTGGNAGGLTLDNLTAADNAVPCDTIQWEFLGISLAGYNFLLCVVLIAALLFLFVHALRTKSA